MPSQSSRLKNLPPYVFSTIGDRIRAMQKQGIDVIRLDIGNPDMPPPDAVVEALAQSARNPNKHGYSGYRGIPEFRQAIAQYYHNRFGVTLDPDTEVLPLIGSKEGLVNLCFAYIGDGDVSLVPDIAYPAYAMGTQLAGGDVHWVPLQSENDYVPDLKSIPKDVAQKAKILWVNYPNNPTGANIDLNVYTQIAAFCNEHDILLASDNPYMDILFDENTAHSALQTAYGTKNILEFFSFSKSFNMAGWRLGAAIGDAEAISHLLHVKSNVDSGHFKAVYDAGITALQTPQTWIDARNAIYEKRRDRILEALPAIGLSARKSKGSLYVWAKVEDRDVDTYIEQALTHAHISLAPGKAYGPGGDGYIRISVGTPDNVLEESLQRLESWYAKVTL